jgi:hypothetical protein
VKQRLAHGRKLLQERALAYVEGALQCTNPGHAFTLGVLAALTLSATSAKALTAGAAVKGSSTAKTVASLAAVGAMALYWSLLGFLAFVGGCASYWMSRSCAKSPRQCENAIQFWRVLAWSFVLCFIIRQCLQLDLTHGQASHLEWFIWKLCLDLFYVVIVAALSIWMLQWWREFSIPRADLQEPPRLLKGRLVLWLLLGMMGPACLFVPIVGATVWQTFGPATVQHLSNAEAQKIINGRQDAHFSVLQDEDGTKTLRVYLPENDPGTKLWAAANMPAWWNQWTLRSGPAWWNLWTGPKEGNVPVWWNNLLYWSGYRPVDLLAVADDSTLKLLNDKGIHYVSGSRRQVSREAWPFG